jgi:hypothetical protein
MKTYVRIHTKGYSVHTLESAINSETRHNNAEIVSITKLEDGVIAVLYRKLEEVQADESI